MSSKVSVIIPTYNRADLLPRAIKSVIAQTYTNWELLVVDDGSTDNTKEVVEEFIKKDKRIKYLWEPNSGGASKPRNFGAKNAKGEYIAFLDSDDEWLPNNLEEHIEIHKKYPDIDLSGSNLRAQGSKNKWFSDKDIIIRPNLEWALSHWISPDTMFFKKTFFDKIGGFDENLKCGEDGDITIRSVMVGKVYLLNACLVIGHSSSNSITQSASKRGDDKLIKSFFVKNFPIYQKFDKLSLYYFKWGLANCLAGNFIIGRNYLKQSLKYPDRKIIFLISYITSIFGKKFWLFAYKLYKYIH